MRQSIRQDDGRHQGGVHGGARGAAGAGGDDPRQGQLLLECCGHHVRAAGTHETRQVADTEIMHAQDPPKEPR